MLRQRFTEALKSALKSGDQRRVSALRLILAALKDRDIAAREQGNRDGIAEDAVLQLLSNMVKQRRESIKLYEQGNRADLVKQEQDEILVIESFMPQQMAEAEVQKAVADAIAEIGASGLKDIGRTMGVLKTRYAGRMDFGKASEYVRKTLAA